MELLKKPGILIVLMGHKILTWYFNQKNSKKTEVQQDRVEVVAPVEENQVDDEGKCPICTKLIKIATMVRHSGYVYCFDCINQYIRR
jgi:hypothetical protein